MAYAMIGVLLLAGLLFKWAGLDSDAIWIAWLAALVEIPTQYGIINGWINAQASKHYQPGLASSPQPPGPPG